MAKSSRTTLDGRKLPPAEAPVEGLDVGGVLARVRIDDTFVSGLTLLDIVRYAALRLSRMNHKNADGTEEDHDDLAFGLTGLLDLPTGIVDEDLPQQPVGVGIPGSYEAKLPDGMGVAMMLPTGVGMVLRAEDVSLPSAVDPNVLKHVHGEEPKTHHMLDGPAEMARIERQGNRATPSQLSRIEARAQKRDLEAKRLRGETPAEALVGAI